MGFDISGCNPKQNTPFPKACLDLQEKYQKDSDDMFWLDNATDAERSKYFYHRTKWQTENVGEYFRSPIWIWHTAINFIDYCCSREGDFFTEDDFEGCSYNEHYHIPAEKAEKMGHAIIKAVTDKALKVYYNSYAKYQKNKGRVHEDDVAMKVVDTPLGKMDVKVDNKIETYHSYDRLKNHVLDFADFAIASGGFTVGQS